MKNKTKLLPKKSMGHQVRIAHRDFERLLNAFLSPHGLKAGYWYYMRALWQQDNISQRELSNCVNVMEATSVTMLLGMENAGLIERKRDIKDKRKRNILLTSKGRQLETTLMPIAISINTIATSGISKQDIETCLSVLTKLNQNMSSYVNVRNTL